MALIALLAAGCEGGGGNPVRLYFGMTNSDACSRLEIFVDLEQGGAEVKRLDDGTLDCLLSPALVGEGCTASFVETDGGGTLSIELGDCDVFRYDALFQCGFDRVDLSTINAAVVASCDCAGSPECELNGPTCYRSPGICMTVSPGGDDCEHCDNNVDDDGDGKVDCDDPKCWYDCGVGLTTVTCPTSTSMTTSTSMLAEPVEAEPYRLDRDLAR
jgi:hypothetical protein